MAGQPHVLVIDDDPLFRKLITGLLKNVYSVATAETGSEGFRLAIEHPPHIVLIDVCMPGWNGLETLQKFREHPQLSRTKTAMLTGDASRDTVVKAIRSGTDDYIVKSNINRCELLRKLQSLLGRSAVPAEKSSCAGESVCSPRRKSAEAREAENDWDPRLQGIIDHWE